MASAVGLCLVGRKAAVLPPAGKWWVGQSADNQLLTYSANDRVRPNRKKTFKGHAAAGYACQPAFSHDDHYVISGDGEGKLFVWDWKTTKVRLGRRRCVAARAPLPCRCAAAALLCTRPLTAPALLPHLVPRHGCTEF
jgi:hypothetical protein